MDRKTLIDTLGDGLICAVTFTKADGTVREMQCRLGVKSALAGGKKSYDDAEKNILTVYDMVNKGYRSIKIETIRKIVAHGSTIYEVK